MKCTEQPLERAHREDADWADVLHGGEPAVDGVLDLLLPHLCEMAHGAVEAPKGTRKRPDCEWLQPWLPP